MQLRPAQSQVVKAPHRATTPDDLKAKIEDATRGPNVPVCIRFEEKDQNQLLRSGEVTINQHTQDLLLDEDEGLVGIEDYSAPQTPQVNNVKLFLNEDSITLKYTINQNKRGNERFKESFLPTIQQT